MTEEKPSGLRNPQAAVRGVGAGALAAEGLVLLLAIVPMRVLGGERGGATVAVVVALAVVSFALAGMLGHSWAWHAGSALQVVLFVCGLIFHVALTVLAVLFGLVWIYVLYVRRSVVGKGQSNGSR